MVNTGTGRVDGAQITFRQAVEFRKMGVCRESIRMVAVKHPNPRRFYDRPDLRIIFGGHLFTWIRYSKAMKCCRFFLPFLFLLLVIAACAPFVLAQASATDPGRANPRNVDATSFGDLIATRSRLALRSRRRSGLGLARLRRQRLEDCLHGKAADLLRLSRSPLCLVPDSHPSAPRHAQPDGRDHSASPAISRSMPTASASEAAAR